MMRWKPYTPAMFGFALGWTVLGVMAIASAITLNRAFFIAQGSAAAAVCLLIFVLRRITR